VSRSVVVLGAGLAGLAAAFGAARAGRAVTIVSTGAGATALAPGAIDDVPWERAAHAARVAGVPLAARRLGDDVRAFADALGLWTLAADGGPTLRLATTAGLVRPARGCDRALLDLAPIRGDVVVPRAPRAGWDADALAAAWSADPWARAAGLRFVAAEAALLRQKGERAIGEPDLALRHDDEARLDWLADRLRELLAREASRGVYAEGILLGPWLGASAPRADALSAKLGLPVGEALGSVGSAAGLRFEAARDRLLATLGVERIDGRARRVDVEAGRVAVSVEGRSDLVVGDACVLACGGVAGGGVAYRGGRAPDRARPAFALSLEAPVDLALGGALVDVASSLLGPGLDETAWPSPFSDGALERVGVRCEGARAAPSITAAGAVVADRPRTALEAVASGLRAGREA
jgi:glycerol-3-phosphate dehydrogenase subunit B